MVTCFSSRNRFALSASVISSGSSFSASLRSSLYSLSNAEFMVRAASVVLDCCLVQVPSTQQLVVAGPPKRNKRDCAG